MKYLSLIVVCLITFFSHANHVKVTKTPTWVNEVQLRSDSITSKGGGYQYLMIDYQENIPLQSSYYHNIVSVLNSEGIQEKSDLHFSFDPAYQTLTVHKLQVIRDGVIIDKIDLPIEVIQQESRQSQSLYDKSLSAIIHFDDIQKNDIIEYAYSITGYNPIYKQNYSTQLSLQYNVPINHFYYRIISEDELTYKTLDSASTPEILKKKDNIEYIWNESSFDVVSYDVQVPYWYNIQKRIDISTYKSWKDVSDIIYPLYAYNKEEIPSITEAILNKTDVKDTVLAFINFVQDDIRYLGLEAGLNAYQPHNPKFVFDQKYGDCKDKALLLVALLRSVGLEANPVLVSSWKAQTIWDNLPSIDAFNHCVVYFKKEGKSYYIDPTITNQGGDIDHIYFPNYEYGLILSDHSEALTVLPKHKIYKTSVYEEFDIKHHGEPSYLEIKTEYLGDNADEMRAYFNGNSQSKIEKSYLDYYSELYPNISVHKPVEVIDELSNSLNLFIVKEYYKMDSIWVANSEYPGILTIDLYSLAISNYIQYTNSANRTQPYSIGTPTYYNQIKHFNLPEAWPMEPLHERISGSGFEYEFEASGERNMMTLEYNYQTFLEWIPANQVKPFLKKHDEIYENMSYQISYAKEDENAGISWFSVIMIIGFICGGIFFGRKLYLNYNPITNKNVSTLKIGGWLVFPLIGLILTPFAVAYQVVTSGMLNANIWSNAGFLTNHSFLFNGLLVIESAYHVALIIFSIILIILFFQQRSSVPKLMLVYYVVTISFPILDALAIDYIINTNSLYEILGGQKILRTLAVMFIWIPYFIKSIRVKNTFGKVLLNGQLIHTGDLYKAENVNDEQEDVE